MSKFFSFFIFLFLISSSQSQVFIPLSYYTERNNCTANYCPTLTPIVATAKGTAGMTQIVSSCVDDGFTQINLPFDVHMSDVNYNTWFIGSNTYLTAGTGSTQYSSLGASGPALPKFLFGGTDANYQKVYSISGTNYFRFRSEGNTPYSNCSAINVIYEVTIFRPTVNYQFVQVVFVSHGNLNAPFGAASASAYYATTTPFAITSYVFYSYNGGNSWFLLTNYSITGAGTTL